MIINLQDAKLSKKDKTPAVQTLVLSLAERIAKTAPTLSDLNQEQLQQIAQIVLTQRLTNQLNAAVNLAGIDYKAERSLFIANAGRVNSRHTRSGYTEALSRLEEYASKIKICVLELSPARADDFIYSLQGRSSASVRRDVAACSSFFSFLERRHEGIRNPFRGTKARPPKKAARKAEIPSMEEVETIVRYSPWLMALAVAVMAFRGLRVGALPSMIIRGNRFTAHSKGKDITGELPDRVLSIMKEASLESKTQESKTPFSEFTDNALKKQVIYYTNLLYKAKKINAPYSCHDFRHFFAVSEYKKHKDIYRLSKLLHHSGIQITETYLKSLGFESL